MRTNELLVLTAALAAFSGCFSKITDESGPGNEEWPDYMNPDGDICIVTGVAYPEGTEWNGGRWNSPAAKVVMYKDGQLTASVSTRPADEKATCDPSMHFYCNGSLYCGYISPTQTVISRNGEELFRFRDRENIFFLSEHENRVLTAGESEDGNDFFFRSDGQLVFAGYGGQAFRNVCVDGNGNIHLYYKTKVNSTSGVIEQFHCLHGKNSIQIDLPPNIRDVYGFAMDGEDHIALCSNGASGGSVISGTYHTGAKHFSGTSTYNFDSAVVLSGDAPLVGLAYSKLGYAYGKTYTVILSGNRIKLSWENGGGYAVGFRRMADGELAGVRKSQDENGVDLLYRAARRDSLPEGYTVMCDNAVSIGKDGRAAIGLSSKTGGRAILWTEGKVDSLDFYGIVSGVYLEDRPEEEPVETVRTTEWKP